MVAYWPTGLPWAYPYAYVDVNPAQGQGLPERRRLHGALVYFVHFTLEERSDE